MIDEATMTALRAANPGVDLYPLTAMAGTQDIVVRRPTRPEYKQFRAMASDEKKRPEAAESLVRLVLVHPERSAWDATLARYPALGDTFASEVLKLAGATGDAEGKEL